MIDLIKEGLGLDGNTSRYHGALAEFETASGLYSACERVRDAGFKKWDAHTPFPVHGLERAMGIPASKVPWICLGGALTGALTAFLFQWWMHSYAYPLVISGKPLFAWPAYVPIIFELGVLFGAFGSFFGMFALNQLPRLHHSLFNSERFSRVTDDRFFISIEAIDPSFDETETKTFLQGLGASHVELVEK